MAYFDLLTTSLFVPVELNFELAGAIFFLSAARSAAKGSRSNLLVIVSHTIMAVIALISAGVVLVVVYHSLILGLSS